jgi:chromosome segregation ATPase
MFSPLQIYAVLIVIAAAGGYVAYSKYQINSVKTELATKEAELTQTKANLVVVENANTQNLTTIGHLQEEKRLLDAVAADLAAKSKQNQRTIDTLFKTIRSFKDDPASQAPLSPVLKATVEQIQVERAARASGASK